ncbi:predicted protein [Chaetoceros tenuissimus]|uniref:Uncharacterized protein n=1 Tax=Chaetoceros tenuissimus TaxID=426638 RepID=A0AAD3D506_9STRA|nr:predicted protein [Chaetoceros tenuissimus]
MELLKPLKSEDQATTVVEVQIKREDPAQVIGKSNPMDCTYSKDQTPKPVKSRLIIRRGAHSSGPNKGHAKLVIPILFVNGESLCSLQDVIVAIDHTGIDEISRSHRGYNDFLKVKEVTPRLMSSLFAEFSAGNFWFVDEEHEDDDIIWELVSSLSSLCTFPWIIMTIFQKVNLPDEFKNAKRDPLLLTFALRNVLARLAFNTKLQNKIRVTLREEMENNGYKLVQQDKISTDAIAAFVGFNRLLSPNNNTGVSYSSDIDYKLIIDCRELMNGDGSPLNGGQVKKLVKKLNTAQEEDDIKRAFDRDAKMLLEVADFTTRDLAELEKYLGEDEREQNFLASIYRNNIHIGGSASIYNKFQELLDKFNESNGLEIARRTWIQYLGQSDKGSVMWISKAAELKDFFGGVSEIIISYLGDNVESLRELKKKLLEQGDIEAVKIEEAFASNSETKGKKQHDPSSRHKWLKSPKEHEDAPWKKWLHSPKVLKVALKIDEISNIIFAYPIIKTGLQELDMFPGNLLLKEQLSIAMKVFTGLVDDGVYEPKAANECLMQIGSTLCTDDNWRFSLKYAGCRLNDFFDSVTFDDYKKWCIGMDAKEVSRRYNTGQAIASVINEFALRMQNFIYLLAATPDENFPETTGKSHEDIDALYSRMTKACFHEMVIRSKYTTDVEIHYALNILGRGILGLHLSKLPIIANLKEIIRNLASSIGSDHNEVNGKPLFDGIFELVIETSKFLKPPETE